MMNLITRLGLVMHGATLETKRVSGLKVSPEQKLRSYIAVADLGCALTPSAQPDNKAWSCYDWGCIRGKA